MRLRRLCAATLVGAAMGFFTSCGSIHLGGSLGAGEPVASEEADFIVELVADGLEHPWALAFLPDGGMLVTERAGQLRRLQPDLTLDAEPLTGLPTAFARGQGGLLDIALHPDFAQNRLVYLSYAYLASGTAGAGAGTAVARGRLEGDGLHDTDVIFRSNGLTSRGQHFGSRLLFDDDGFLYVTHGDRGERALAQDLGSHAGSLLRLAADGGAAADNPFAGQADALPEIYSYGHRNAQGMALHPETRRLWLHEHGPRGGDEINIIEPGANYGWPVVSLGREYASRQAVGVPDAPGMIDPIHAWDPSIAPSGMAFYEGTAFLAWQGDLLVGALAHQVLVRLELDGERVVHEERLLEGALGRIRDVRVGPEGYVYLLIDAADGALYRLVPVPEEVG